VTEPGDASDEGFVGAVVRDRDRDGSVAALTDPLRLTSSVDNLLHRPPRDQRDARSS
jgi:hypothetical protein